MHGPTRANRSGRTEAVSRMPVTSATFPKRPKGEGVERLAVSKRLGRARRSRSPVEDVFGFQHPMILAGSSSAPSRWRVRPRSLAR